MTPNNPSKPVPRRLVERQRDDALREAKAFYAAGQYLAAALRFSLPGLQRPECNDPFYADAKKALMCWERVTDEGNFS